MSQHWEMSMAQVKDDFKLIKQTLNNLQKSLEQDIRNLEKSQRNVQKIILSISAVSANSSPSPAKLISHGNNEVHFNVALPRYYVAPAQASRHLTDRLNDTKENNHQNIVMKNFCKICSRHYGEEPTDHSSKYCGQKRVQCQRCFANIRRKNYEQHTNKCLIVRCQNCDQSFFYKASDYHHMNNCRRTAFSAYAIPESSIANAKSSQKKQSLSRWRQKAIKKKQKAIPVMQKCPKLKTGQFSRLNPCGY